MSVLGRRVRAALTVGMAMAAFAVGLGAPASQAAEPAPPVKSDSADKPVYLIKGYTADSPGCSRKWDKAKRSMKSWGWTGEFVKVGFYTADIGGGCTVNIAKDGDADTSIKYLGQQLAWDIHRRYTSKGKSVDVITHSMGGLIARAALAGTQRGEDGFPPKLYVEDVVTLGTPHRGGILTYFCGNVEGQQCQDMRPSSPFMAWLGPTLPQGEGGTDWTLIASHFDYVANVNSATPEAAGAQHLVRYAMSAQLNHSELRTQRTGTHRMNYTNNGSPWRHMRYGAAPVRAAMNAIYWADRW
ncbi:esterase/lipase family protein [Streptomyces syringium]|uniref:esterase/lipase family protein n=1 Tax=Streptomyces syringium TaxID=76729 RepID=UPI0033F323E3